jgi:hypothetical protein
MEINRRKHLNIKRHLRHLKDSVKEHVQNILHFYVMSIYRDLVNGSRTLLTSIPMDFKGMTHVRFG